MKNLKENKKMMRGLFYTFSWIILLIAFLLIILISFWYFYPYKPIEFLTEPHNVTTPTVVAGGHVNFKLDYCKYMDLGAEITVTFVDGFLYNTIPIASNIEVGCHSIENSVYIPRAIPLGTYSIKTLYRYKVNPIRTIDVITISDKFKVVANK